MAYPEAAVSPLFETHARLVHRNRLRRLTGFCCSLLIHLAVPLGLALCSNVPLLQNPGERVVLYLFVPPRASDQTAKVSTAGFGTPLPPPKTGVELDLSGIRLDIRDDSSFEILTVLRLRGGLIGFAPAGRPQYLTHLFHPGDWKAVSDGTWVALSAFFAVRFSQPEQWPGIVKLRGEHGIDKGASVFALFPPSFQDEIAAEIREEAGKRLLRGLATAAVIRFSARERRGFVVESITLTEPRMHTDKR